MCSLLVPGNFVGAIIAYFKWGGCSLNVPVSYVPTLKAVTFVIPPLDYFSLLVFPTLLPHILHCFQGIVRGEVEEPGFEFPVCKKKSSHIVYCFQSSVMKLKKCDISLKWKAKAKFTW